MANCIGGTGAAHDLRCYNNLVRDAVPWNNQNGYYGNCVQLSWVRSSTITTNARYVMD